MGFFRKGRQQLFENMNEVAVLKVKGVDEHIQAQFNFLNITEKDLLCIRDAATVLAPYKQEIIDRFYSRITSIDNFHDLISTHSTIDRLKRAMYNYLENFLEAQLNNEYIEAREAIGKKHSQIHLTADFFIAAHQQLIGIIIRVIMEELHRQPNRMSSMVLAIQKLAAFDQQLIVDVYMEETFKDPLFGVTRTLDYTTQLDTSKVLLEEMDRMNEQSHNVTSVTEEVSASIQEVANQSVKVAEGTDEALQSTEQSKQVVHRTLEDVEQVGQVYQQVVEQVEHLNDEIEKTYDIVGMIRQITEQTNLLALNASIEAARAGEHGQGFAVVANEVRSLAEHTKEQTLLITDNMETLQNVSNLVTKQMNDTEDMVKKSVAGAQVASEELNTIVEVMEGISHATSQIAAMSEEQTSAVNEIAINNSEIFNLSNSSQDIAKETAKVIYELSQQMEENRNIFIESNIRLMDEDIVELSKTDHLLWKWRVHNVLLGLDELHSSDVTSHDECRLGLWYYGDLSSRVSSSPSFQMLEEPHKEVHRLAREALQHYEAGNMHEAEAVYAQIEEASDRVVGLLTAINKEL